jgi:uncharacterized membrane protein SpoIIM required for sporulation
MLSLVVFALAVIALPLIFIKLIYPDLLRKRPAFAGIAAAFFVLVGFLSAFFVFSVALSMAMLTFSSLMLLPFIVKILEPGNEGMKEASQSGKKRMIEILTRHNTLITFYMFLFAGMALEYMLLYAVLPPGIVENAFSNQLALFGPAGRFADPFASILTNNLQIALIAFALSVFYGAGSIFILSYNASIAGVMYGASLRTVIWGGVPFAPNIIAYLPHTVLEILAYLFAAVGGGILIRGLTKENVRDSGIFAVLAVIFLVIAALVEVTVPFL